MKNLIDENVKLTDEDIKKLEQDPVHGGQLKAISKVFDFIIETRIKRVTGSISYLMFFVVILFGLIAYKDFTNTQKIKLLQSELHVVTTELAQSRERIELLDEKTKPKNIDFALRTFFESQIKQSPQVRGVDGNLPKER